MADVRTNVALSFVTDFVDYTEFQPGPHQVSALDTLFGEVVAWSDALAHLRQPRARCLELWTALAPHKSDADGARELSETPGCPQ